MAEENKNETSGAPDKTTPSTVDVNRPELEPSPVAESIETPFPTADGKQVIWDENNVLVHPEANEWHVQEHERVLGIHGTEESAKLKMANPDAIKLSQQRPSQTADPLTNPRPVTDPNMMPSFSVGYAPQAKVDKMILDAAKSENRDNTPLSNVETVDGTKTTDAEIQFPSSPSIPEGAPVDSPQTPMAPSSEIPPEDKTPVTGRSRR